MESGTAKVYSPGRGGFVRLREVTMKNRREFAVSVLGSFVAAAAMPAFAAPNPSDEPTANLIVGHPDILDFGDGLKIPMSKAAFRTLWEDQKFWLAYGLGSSDYTIEASGRAQTAAIGTMKLLLLTLAFAPERLVQVNGCGWTLKDPAAKNYVLGDIAVPGKPFRPVNDANSSNANLAQLYQFAQGSMMGGNAPGAPVGAGNTAGFDISGTDMKVHALTGYMVWKRDVTLDYVRKNAQLL
jgi:hypothetical protein